MKTTNEILTDIWRIVSTSPITLLSGGIYKKTRPTDSSLEDCVISLISGVTAKFLQSEALYVKLFYVDVKRDNTYFEDEIRGQVLEQLLLALSETLLKTEGYSFDIQTRETYTERVIELNQHFAILKMNFQIINN